VVPFVVESMMGDIVPRFSVVSFVVESMMGDIVPRFSVDVVVSLSTKEKFKFKLKKRIIKASR